MHFFEIDLPSGIVRKGKISILGNGVVIDPWALLNEIEEIKKQGESVTRVHSIYVVDDKDPIIQSYQDIFPDLFSLGADMSDELLDHIRYPEDLFTIQSDMYRDYHMTDPFHVSVGLRWSL